MNQQRRDAKARADLRRYAPIAVVLALLVTGCRRPGHFVDEGMQEDAPVRDVTSRGCGPVTPAIRVYHRGTGHVAFHTRVAWCHAYVRADDVVYANGRHPIAGDLITCEWDGEALNPATDLEIRDEDRPR